MSKKKKPSPQIQQDPALGSESPASESNLEAPAEPEVIEAIQEQTQHLARIEARFQHFSGPLPPPEALEKYEKILPGAADRIFIMAEENNRFMMEMDEEVIRSQFQERRRGQFFGFMLGIFGLGGSFWLASIGHDWAAVGLGGGTLAGLVSTFVYGQLHKASMPPEKTKPQ
ncbi:MAG: DUF2335 domain-containing protein [Nitrospirales bacterium]|nr:DUF2335 domain-containing protein [Nitrospirales bacterium]